MIDDFKNNIDFYIRSLTKFSRKNFVEKNPVIIEQIEKENLYVYDILNKYFEKMALKCTKILDIGSKNWFYAKAEHKFFSEFCDDFILDGVELDAYRLYSNFYSRYEAAKYYTRGLENTNYIPSNLLDIKEKYDYIVWFLPFVVIYPLVRWGLPKRFFCPELLLRHAYSLLNDGGQMLIINQENYEAEAQKKYLDDLNTNKTQ